MKPVMVIGGAGVFGSRLVSQLAEIGKGGAIIAGRSPEHAAPLIESLRAAGHAARFEAFDRSAPDIARLAAIGPAAIVDAAGPFQGADLALPRAAIAARIPYIDLADARDFVKAFPALDGAARAAGVAAITGASSTPALSHAVLDRITAGWRRIDRVFVAISPGNRAPRGLSVTRAILGYAGKPVQVFREGRVETARGWSDDQAIMIDGVGKRHVVTCETPDLDLLPARYAPRIAAEFKAGLELGVMHHGLRLLSAMRVPFLPHAARPLLWLAKALQPFGTDIGGMLVEAAGIDSAGRAVRARWSLAAPGGIGPTVPVLPALALLARLDTLTPGAYSAAGVLGYAEIEHHLHRIGVRTHTAADELTGPQLTERVLGQAWSAIPETTRRVHSAIPGIVLDGEATIDGAETVMGRVIARLFGFPEAGNNVPVRVVIESDGQRERWARHYPARTMRSIMTNADPARGTLEEWLGPFRFRLRLDASPAGIGLTPEQVSLRGLPLPAWLLPRVSATERSDSAGRHLFDVSISLKPFGRLVHYRGWLSPAAGFCRLPCG